MSSPTAVGRAVIPFAALTPAACDVVADTAEEAMGVFATWHIPKAREAFEPLREILANAKFPDPGRKGHLISGWSEAAAARVEELAELMRAELTGEGS